MNNLIACPECHGRGKYQIRDLVDLFDKLDAMKYDRNKRGLMPLSFRAWLKIAREWNREGVECVECQGEGIMFAKNEYCVES